MAQFTKQALAQTLKKKLETKSLEKITVTELVEACGVNRQTFYYHFQDIYDLLGWIYKTEALQLIENNKTYSTWQQGLLIILNYVAENKKFCMRTYHSVARDHIEQFLNKTLYQLLMDVVNEFPDASKITEENRGFIIKFYSFAFLGTLLEWIDEGLEKPPATITDNIGKIMEGHIRSSLQRFML